MIVNWLSISIMLAAHIVTLLFLLLAPRAFQLDNNMISAVLVQWGRDKNMDLTLLLRFQQHLKCQKEQ